MLGAQQIAHLREITVRDVLAATGPCELEAEVNYPGSPKAKEGPGSGTIRRLLQAHARDAAFAQWFADQRIHADLAQLLGGPIQQTRAHHNCIMTKQPRFSSDTGWHQDIRYWSFTRAELISVWLALGEENRNNGCLRVIPGSHRMQYDLTQWDERKFFRDDLPQNIALLKSEQMVELQAGDVLYFHACLLHAATRNYTQETKYAVVASYRRQDNLPLPGSRSAEKD